MLSGCLGLYVTTLGLFALGISLTPWHGLGFLLPAWVAGWIGTRGPKRTQETSQIILLALTFCGLMAAVASRFDDLSVDGMQARIESVLALSAGWNPVKDPTFQEGAQLKESHASLRGSFVVQSGYQYSFGNLLSAYLSHLTGNLNAGKAVTPILAVASFGIVFGGLTSLALPTGWCMALALMAAFNPVSIYQSSSYYIDGHTGALFTAMLFAALRLLVTGLKTDGLIALVVSFLGLSASKTSGLFYGVIIDLVFLGFYGLLNLKNLRPVLLFVGISALVTWPVGFFFRKVGGFPPLTLEYLLAATNPATSGYGVGQYSYGLDAMLKLDQAQIFVMSHFAPTEVIPENTKTKFPFWFNRRELSVFEDLTPDARAGGFGPLYGGSVILAMASFGMILLGRAPPWPAFFPLLPVLFSVGFTQAWWARWCPQGWLLPTALLIPLVCSLASGPASKRWIPPPPGRICRPSQQRFDSSFLLCGMLPGPTTFGFPTPLFKIPAGSPFRLHAEICK